MFVPCVSVVCAMKTCLRRASLHRCNMRRPRSLFLVCLALFGFACAEGGIGDDAGTDAATELDTSVPGQDASVAEDAATGNDASTNDASTEDGSAEEDASTEEDASVKHLAVGPFG